jgi:PAS domain S-box-containing protein
MAASTDAVMTYDVDKRITSFGPASERMFGYSAQEAIGRDYLFLIPKRFHKTYLARWEEFAASEGDVYQRTALDPVIMLRKDGREFPVSLSASKIAVGDSVVLATSMRDLGTANAAGIDLALFQARLAGIITLSEDAIITVDRDHRITLFNAAAEQIFGYSAREVMGQHMELLIPPRLRDLHRRHIEDFVALADVHQLRRPDPILALRKNGEEFPCESTVGKFIVNDEQILTVRLRDISEKVLADAALAMSQGRLEGIVSLSDDAIITVDEAQRITLFNPAAERTFGYSQREVLGQSIELLIPQRLHRAHRQHVAGFVASGDESRQMSLTGPITARRKNGEEFPAESAVARFALKGEQVLTVRLRDITERVRADAALAMSQQRLAGMVALSDHAIITVDEAQRITLFNPAAEHIFGYSEAEALGRSFEMLIPRRLRHIHRRHVTEFVRSTDETRSMSLAGPITALRKNGEEFPAESAVAKFAVNGELVLTVRLRDVTEKVKADEMRVKLLAAEESSRLKMQLISTVSHELRSPLAAILGFTSLLIDYGDRLEAEERLMQLHVIEDSTRHLQRIVDDLLVLSRLEAGVLDIQREPVPLQGLFDSVLAAFGSVSTHGIIVVPRSTSLIVMGDQSRLRQVLSNLLDNAIKYSPHGGEIEIRCRRSRDGVTITVRDYGPGVPPDEIELIFEAFYRGANATADEAIKSTGLGLAICKGFVEAHGGEIRARLPEGGGLAVAITLPLAAMQPVQ